MSFLSEAKEILEVGNVLNHYVPFRHDVVDKYERADGVINEDICIFDTDKKYDLICSISTLEHVGWDEAQKNPNGMADAIANLRRLLATKGKIVCTVPIGWNPNVDKLLKERPPFSEMFAFRRINRLNQWEQVQFEDIRNAEFYAPFPFANAIVLGIATR